ncbi:MAG: endolytic transglycosylase MltG [Geminicoccaceae bacterium]|nr:endolytic transglycosylase MltG [Geminicoccaceae bacterium]
MQRFFGTLFVLLLLAVAVAWGGLWWLKERYLLEPGPLRQAAVVDLPRGAGVAAIARRLEEAGAVGNALLFRLAARATGQDRALKAGEYQLEPGASPAAILALLESGKVLLHPLTLPEGITAAEAVRAIEASDILAGKLEKRPEEGSLLPETYLFPRGTPRKEAVARMQGAMRAVLAKAWAARKPGLPLEGQNDLLTLASIIEKETAVAEEYPLVASVFVNRLKRDMPLQTDPTVIYALTEGETTLGRTLTRKDLDETESPYNTYKTKGLPPGPIALPGPAAIAAAAQPADTKFLYFVADGSGGHAFAATLAQHNHNVTQWRLLSRQKK